MSETSRRELLKAIAAAALAGPLTLEAAQHVHGIAAEEKAAGACEFIDLLASQNPQLLAIYTGGIAWLDRTMRQRDQVDFVSASPAQQTAMLDLIAYRKNAKKDPGLAQGIEFFAFLRKLTADGFFTSEIGIDYLGYIGNTYLQEFPGCPPVPET